MAIDPDGSQLENANLGALIAFGHDSDAFFDDIVHS